MIGPPGVALLGQLTNTTSILLTFANGGITNGITKYVAEFKNQNKIFQETLSTALFITICCSSLIGAALIIFCRGISLLIFYSTEYYYIFIIFGLTILFYALNILLISVINGLKKFKLYVVANIVGSLVSLTTSVVLVVLWGVTGALINTVIFQSLIFFSTLYLCRKEKWIDISVFKHKVSTKIVRKLFAFSLMAITTTTLFPLVQLLIRERIISCISMEKAGWWEGMNRISTMYLYVIMTAFSVYYLPKISESESDKEVKYEIIKCGSFLLPIIVVSGITIFLCRDIIIKLLFTDSFLGMNELFIWQLTGDSIKVCSWLFSFILVAKAQVKKYIIAECMSALLYLCVSIYLLEIYGIVGAVQAYVVMCIMYFSLIIYCSKNYWR